MFHPVLLDACLHFTLHPDIAQPMNPETTFLPRKLQRLAVYALPTYDGPIFSHVKLVDWTPGKPSKLVHGLGTHWICRLASIQPKCI